MPYHDAIMLFQQGLACLRARQYAAALVAFTHAIEIDPLFVPASQAPSVGVLLL
jgi:hypothetical protein